MNFQRVLAVFQIIGFPQGLPGQFAGFSNRHKRSTQLSGKRAAKNESARLHGNDRIDIFGFVTVRQSSDDHLKAFGVLQKRGDILKNNSIFGKIRNVTDQVLEIHKTFFYHQCTKSQEIQIWTIKAAIQKLLRGFKCGGENWYGLVGGNLTQIRSKVHDNLRGSTSSTSGFFEGLFLRFGGSVRELHPKPSRFVLKFS